MRIVIMIFCFCAALFAAFGAYAFFAPQAERGNCDISCGTWKSDQVTIRMEPNGRAHVSGAKCDIVTYNFQTAICGYDCSRENYDKIMYKHIYFRERDGTSHHYYWRKGPPDYDYMQLAHMTGSPKKDVCGLNNIYDRG